MSTPLSIHQHFCGDVGELSEQQTSDVRKSGVVTRAVSRRLCKISTSIGKSQSSPLHWFPTPLDIKITHSFLKHIEKCRARLTDHLWKNLNGLWGGQCLDGCMSIELHEQSCYTSYNCSGVHVLSQSHASKRNKSRSDILYISQYYLSRILGVPSTTCVVLSQISEI